ncbi:MAG: DUF72 domain-containing protein, partial [Pseudopedobacter saltans]
KNYTSLLEKLGMTNIIVDTAGRRELLHMHLTNDTAFVRYVGANAASDYDRLDEWVDRIVKWREEGLKTLYFFIHQNVEEASPLLAAHFIKGINEKTGLTISVPNKADASISLF